MVHDHAPVVSCVPYSPGGWFIPLATTQLSGAPAAQVSRQPEICTVAPGERLGRVVATNVSDSGAAPVGTIVVVGGTVVVVVVGGAVVVGAEVVEVVVVVAAVVDVVVVGTAVVVVVGGVSSVESLAAAKVVGGPIVVVVVVVVVGDGSSAAVVVVVVDEGDAPSAVVVVVVVVDEGDASGSSAEAASTGSDELDESPRLAIAHTPRPPIISPLTRKTTLISPQF